MPRNFSRTRLFRIETNAEGDLATATAMAQELTSGGYDLIITLTTGALQAVGNANKQRRVPHVLGLVTDPTKAGVGVGRLDCL